jgi:hypothetical protein
VKKKCRKTQIIQAHWNFGLDGGVRKHTLQADWLQRLELTPDPALGVGRATL